MLRLLFTCTLFLLTATNLCADSPATINGTTRDILYYCRDYPIFIRVHIAVDGNSFEQRWLEYVQSLFSEIDTDGDGRLSVAEVARPAGAKGDQLSPDAKRIARHPDFWSADRNPLDQSISMVELATFLVSNQSGPFQPPETTPAPAVNTGSAGGTLFQLLDMNADRNLTADELSAAATSLHRRDLDDDGTFAVSELTPTSTPFVQPAQQERNEGTRPFVTLTRGSVTVDVLRELERRYAPAPAVSGNQRNSLSRDLDQRDLGLEADVFARFDLDSNGKLDRDELREFVRNPPPTLELVVRLGERDSRQHIVDLTDSAEQHNISIRRSTDGLACVAINDVQIEIAEAAGGAEVAKQYLLRQFAGADRDNNDYIDEDEAERSNVFRSSFGQFDEDGDGKLFEEELTAIVEGRTRAARSRTRMDARNRGRDLFEILDLDRNRRLGRSELAEAVKRIELWDTDNDGAVAEDEIPQLYQITFGPGQPQFRGVQIPGQAARTSESSSAPNPVTPNWFRKLDRNSDRELARREFPGSRSEFQKLDRNGDGVVDAAEAEFAE